MLLRKRSKNTLINYLIENGVDFKEYIKITDSFKYYVKEKIEDKSQEDAFDINSAKENINLNIEYIPKSIFSISRYMLYKDCPRKYFFRYIAKIDADALDIGFLNKKEDEEEQSEVEVVKSINAAEIGSFVHSVLEEVSKGYTVDVEDRINNELGEVGNEDKEKIKRMVESYQKIEKDIKINGQKLFSNQEFVFRVPLPDTSIILMGIIDRLDIYQVSDTKRAVVIDYKTNKVNGEKDKERIKIIIFHSLLPTVMLSRKYMT
ncbi:PD-(D/E)XK nuclease family protein [Caloramator sp. mosi_1]|uniref:RecB family exonuclease n=1 Tax=Caloramator sp. mosi_1 TaxID=3023090 RepID=UPI0023600906|nr:PD-(D/E)XK nuclease family protein [Caloramator sp. mosi_1]WDC84783.1 PD-(D/E)XK nuclease family protein [Caloramator sp. mosi_1]